MVYSCCLITASGSQGGTGTKPKLGLCNWVQTRHYRIIRPEPVHAIWKFKFCRLHMRSKCSSIFRKVTREQNLEGRRTLVWQTLSSLCSWPTSWKRDMIDPPSALLCCFQVPRTFSSPKLFAESHSLSEHCSDVGCQECLIINLCNIVSYKTHLYTNVLREICLGGN